MLKAIEIKALSKTYVGKKRAIVQALTHLDLTIDAGEVFGFLGPNGAGKSTTIKILMGLLFPTSGSVSLFGIPSIDPSSRSKVGYLPENPSLYDFLTGKEYLSFTGKAHGMGPDELGRRTSEILERLQLAAAADRTIRSYSKGMVQRLGIGQAMLHDPELYIFDEPMSGLDPIGRALVKDIIRQLKAEGKTVFFSTHITSDVEAVCDRVGVIVNGHLEALDSVSNILKSGVEGYIVQVKHLSLPVLNNTYMISSQGERHELYVPKDKFNEFVNDIASNDGKIESIETARKDLEMFFLDIVNANNVKAQ